MKKYLIIAIFAVCALIGCKTVYVPVESVRTEYKDRVQRDSVNIFDSIYIKEKGDTIWLTRWRTEYRDRIKTDSIVIRDSVQIPYPVEVIKEVEKPPNWWQKIKLELGGFAFAFLVLLIAYYIRKFIKARK